jgi:signal transduction histidine kinase
MSGDDLLAALTALVWMSCGTAAVCLTPRNRAAQALSAAAVLMTVTMSVEGWLSSATPDDHVFALVRTVAEVTFLGMLAAVVWTLVVHPDGRLDVAWHAWVPRVLAVAAVTAPVAELIGSSRLDLGNEASTARSNPFAASGLGWLGAVGDAVGDTEPLWIVAGVVLLGLRWRGGDPGRREQLRGPLLSLLALTLVLLLVVVGLASGMPTPPEAVTVPAIFVGLCLFPVVVLIGVTREVRTLQAHLAESRSRLWGAEDRARRELGHDLHDGIQQQLVAILSLTRLAERQVRAGRPDACATLEETADLTTTAVAELRELVHGIRPPVLEDQGLAAALRSRIGRLPVEVHLDVQSERRWSPLLEVTAYYVVNEAITNCLKHAPGSGVTVRIAEDGSDLMLSVTDAGPGIRPARGHAPGGHPGPGHGLTGMRDRVESMGGRLEVLSSPGGGTSVSARLPDVPAESR